MLATCVTQYWSCSFLWKTIHCLFKWFWTFERTKLNYQKPKCIEVLSVWPAELVKGSPTLFHESLTLHRPRYPHTSLSPAGIRTVGKSLKHWNTAPNTCRLLILLLSSEETSSSFWPRAFLSLDLDFSGWYWLGSSADASPALMPGCPPRAGRPSVGDLPVGYSQKSLATLGKVIQTLLRFTTQTQSLQMACPLIHSIWKRFLNLSLVLSVVPGVRKIHRQWSLPWKVSVFSGAKTEAITRICIVTASGDPGWGRWYSF